MNQRHSRSRRRPTPLAATGAPLAAGALDRVLALPMMDQALRWLLGQPRALQGAGLLLGVAMVALALRPLIWPASPSVPDSGTVASTLSVPTLVGAAPSDEQDVLNIIAAYNQASITAAVLNRPDPMAPYLAPDGAAWAAVKAEYQRRATRGETHDPALLRWGVLRIAVDGDMATVETQEQWDDVTLIGGQVVSSRRAILTRNTYALRRSPRLAGWHVTDVTTITLIA